MLLLLLTPALAGTGRGAQCRGSATGGTAGGVGDPRTSTRETRPVLRLGAPGSAAVAPFSSTFETSFLDVTL